MATLTQGGGGARRSYAGSSIGTTSQGGRDTPKNMRMSMQSVPSRKFTSLEPKESLSVIKLESSGEQVVPLQLTLLSQGTEILKSRATSGAKSMSTKLLLKYKPGEYTMPP